MNVKAVALIAALAAMETASTQLLAQATFLTQLSDRVVWAGATVKFAASTSGFGSVKYQWLFNSTNLPSGLFITTVAGNGQTNLFYYGTYGTYSGDGGVATNGGLNNPNSVIFDASGNLLIADTSNNRIRKVGTNGMIITIVGNGTNGYSGDGGPATNAELSSPMTMTFDSTGNLFVSDSGNFVIRKVNTNGIITTVAGDGTNAYFAPPPTNGVVATNVNLNNTFGVAVDNAGNLYFSADGDRFSFIFKVNTNGVLTTEAGNGIQSSNPFQVGDNGSATNAYLQSIRGIVLDGTCNLLIADAGNNRIRRIDTNGIITTIAGTGTNSFYGDGKAATNANLSLPESLAWDNAGNLFIADTGNNRIRRVGTNGIISTLAGSSAGFMDNVLATNSTLDQPSGVAVDALGNFFIADTSNQRIRMVTSPQLPNSFAPALTLNNVTATNDGNYQEMITDDYGSATSNIAKLLVVTFPLIYQSAINSSGSFSLSFVCQPGSTNLVLTTTNLSPPTVWLPISTNIAGMDGDWIFTDTNAAVSSARYYRSLTQ